MLFSKYQLIEKIQHRGYSSTAKVINEDEKYFFAKWIRGIKKNSQQARLLKDKLRYLKKAVHSSLPKIIEYDWDEEQGAYCIIFEYIEAETLEEKYWDIEPTYFLKGIEQIISCLKTLQQEFRLSHGDITPANILVDDEMNFYLIDFGLADITATLSQEASKVIFAREFAAPEKWNRELKGKGFPYQADIYSIGKVIEWYFKQKELDEFEDIKLIIDNSCKPEPSNRLNYNTLLESIQKITSTITFSTDNNYVFVYADYSYLNAFDEFIDDLNNDEYKPKFDVNIKNNDIEKIKFKVSTKKFLAFGFWHTSNLKKIGIYKISYKEENEELWNYANKNGIVIPFPIHFLTDRNNFYVTPFNLTPFFKKILRERQHENVYREGKREINKELNFFKELIKKELEVIEKNALKLRYKDFEKKGDYEIWFIKE